MCNTALKPKRRLDNVFQGVGDLVADIKTYIWPFEASCVIEKPRFTMEIYDKKCVYHNYIFNGKGSEVLVS